jgi:hypothetical protein
MQTKDCEIYSQDLLDPYVFFARHGSQSNQYEDQQCVRLQNDEELDLKAPNTFDQSLIMSHFINTNLDS